MSDEQPPSPRHSVPLADAEKEQMLVPISPTTPISPPAISPIPPLLTSPTENAPKSPLSRNSSTNQLALNFVSSPLNPTSTSSPPVSSPFARSRPASSGHSRPVSSGNSRNRLISDDSAYPSQYSSTNTRGSLILYRLASTDDMGTLLPPPPSRLGLNRGSVISSSGDSVISLGSDSKYPLDPGSNSRGLVPYAFDPDDEVVGDRDPDDFDPKEKDKKPPLLSWRGLANIGTILLLILALLILFIFYPVITYFRSYAYNQAVEQNVRINGTGQNAILFNMPTLIDSDTPKSAKSRTGYDGHAYTLVFSDEFNKEGRSFYPGDDPYWEAVDLWYGATADLEWYDPKQITTANGSLVITMTDDPEHALSYTSGMLQSWNKFCFTAGYIEVSLVLPGPDQNTTGYWPGVWTMGNLGRPGYPATTAGTWPYSYDSCDVGTFPNQTLPDLSGPAAAIDCATCQAKYDGRLSWLPGQKLSACSCPGSDHPGPDVTYGRGAPEIDIFEAEKNKLTEVGQVISQSAQFAPFTAEYNYLTATTAEFQIFDDTVTVPNTYKGSAVQQAISCLTDVPADNFQGSGAVYHTYGFEYFSDPSNRDAGFITWGADGSPSVTVGAGAVGPDQGVGGSGVGQRLISEEPMSIVLNLGISKNWQPIDLETMIFPSIMLVDYIRVYQREGSINIGCDPKDRPTADYIARNLVNYQNPNLTEWQGTWPKNSAFSGGC